MSREGVQQGDPLGPLLFSLVLKSLTDMFPSHSCDLNIWYLDDGSIAGEISKVHSILQIIKTEGPRLGLFLNEEKTEICFVAKQKVVTSYDFGKCQVTNIEDLTLLGAAVGSTACSQSFIGNKIDN